MGLETDLITIFIINLIPCIIAIVSVQHRLAEIIDHAFFILFNLPFLALTIVDTEYFRFIGRRISMSVLSILDDIRDQVLNLFITYWYISAFVLLCFIILILYIPRYNDKNKLFWVLIRLIFVISIICLAEGQINSIKDQDKAKLPILDYLTSNTILSLLGSTKIQEVHVQRLIDTAIMKTFIHRDRTGHNFQHNIKQNIVILICESLSSECMEKVYTPFLNDLALKGVWYKHCFANGRESIDAVPSIISAIPHLSDNHFIPYSQLSSCYPRSIATFLRPYSYHTFFFHGARNGSMGFMKFSRGCGYEAYYSMDDYDGPKKDYDDAWGIYDQHFLEFAARTLTSSAIPFHAVFFTLSAHSPYNLPDDYSHAADEQKDIHSAMRYADYSLQHFFQSIRSKAWYSNTLFIITGDHTHLHTGNSKEAYSIPLILFHPDEKEMSAIRERTDVDKVCQQTDILPTVLDYLNINQSDLLPFGESVFAPNAGWAVHYHNGIYSLMKDQTETYFCVASPGNAMQFKKADQLPDSTSADSQHMLLLKSMVQYYNNNLLLPCFKGILRKETDGPH